MMDAVEREYCLMVFHREVLKWVGENWLKERYAMWSEETDPEGSMMVAKLVDTYGSGQWCFSSDCKIAFGEIHKDGGDNWFSSCVLYIIIMIFWAFSIYLEAVAILPQLVLLQRSGNVDNLTGQYVFFLGAYRALYILNWIYRYFTEQRFGRWISCISGLVQTALYTYFFYYYFISWKNNAKLQLPA